MKGKIVVFLFALPFAGVGLWMAWSVSTLLYDGWQAGRWVPVDARLIDAGYSTHHGDDSTTYEAYADYTYEYGGRRLSGRRVALAGGADNIGDFQQRLGARLASARQNGTPVTAWVNPDDPAEAVLDRRIRWELVGFKSIFVLVFGGFGLGVLVWLIRAKATAGTGSSAPREQPWLARDEWQTPSIRSNSRGAMGGMVVFAAAWNLISAPLPFLLYGEIVDKANYAALVGLLFPLVGLGLIVAAVRRVLEWRRFGAAPVVLDPFPGSIGGHVGGTIDLNLPYDPAARFRLTLTGLRSYVSGSGKNRSRRESPTWQQTRLAGTGPGPSGTRLVFRFEVPEGERESDVTQDDEYHLWRLNLAADLPGIDVDRDYEIPVFATGERSTGLTDAGLDVANAEQSRLDDRDALAVFDTHYGPGGREVRFPMGRHAGGGAAGVVFGTAFAAAGWFLGTSEGEWLFGTVFGAIGVLVGAWSLYLLLNSLEVRTEGGDIVTCRRVLGIPVRQRLMRRADIVRLEKHRTMSSQSGRKHTVHYAVRAVGRDGGKLVIGESFTGRGQADAALQYLAREFSLPAEAAASSADSGFDVLAADR